MDLSTKDYKTLMYAFENDILSIDGVRERVDKKQREEILSRHKYSIRQSEADKRWSTYIPDETKKNKRREIKKTKLVDLEDEIIAYQLSLDKNHTEDEITLETLYPEWIEFKRLHTNAETYIIRINNDWCSFYLKDPIIKRPIVELTKLELDTWVHKLIKKNKLTKKSYYNITVIIRQALEYAVDKGILTKNPLSEVKVDRRFFKKVKKPQSKTQVFTKEEVKYIKILAWNDYNNKVKLYELSPLAMIFQFLTGIRIGELCVVKMTDFERPNYCHIQRMLRGEIDEVVEYTKSDDGDRQVYIVKEARKIIEVCCARRKELGLNPDGYIFSITDSYLKHYPITTLYTKYCKILDTIHKSSHKGRKTYVSTLVAAGVNIDTVRKQAGHSDERTTLSNYTFDINEDEEREREITSALTG